MLINSPAGEPSIVIHHFLPFLSITHPSVERQLRRLCYYFDSKVRSVKWLPCCPHINSIVRPIKRTARSRPHYFTLAIVTFFFSTVTVILSQSGYLISPCLLPCYLSGTAAFFPLFRNYSRRGLISSTLRLISYYLNCSTHLDSTHPHS
jgi:hypothetical protein